MKNTGKKKQVPTRLKKQGKHQNQKRKHIQRENENDATTAYSDTKWSDVGPIFLSILWGIQRDCNTNSGG